MTSDFFWLIVKPICWAKLQRRDDFSCICCCVWDNNARSSAKSKSSRKEKRVHLMPLIRMLCNGKNAKLSREIPLVFFAEISSNFEER